MSNGFEEIIDQANPKVKELAIQVRALIHEVMPEVVEVVWPRQRIAGYGVGPKKMSEQFCYIAVFKERINLGFYYGTELPDPDGLLEGTGEPMRHVKISTLDQLENPSLRRLLEVASTHLPKLKS